MFGKDAQDLSVAEQFVLASAVNKPIILLEGSDKLNAVRLDRWRYITEVRARTCAEKIITDETEKQKVVFELVSLAGGPPDPKVKPSLQQALDPYAPGLANTPSRWRNRPPTCHSKRFGPAVCFPRGIRRAKRCWSWPKPCSTGGSKDWTFPRFDWTFFP